MLDLKTIRQSFDDVQTALNRRGGSYDLQRVLDLNQQQREIEGVRSQLQARSNEIGKAVGQQIRAGAESNGPEVAALRAEGNEVKAQLGELEPKEKALKAEIEAILLGIPNLPSATTPDGKDESENVEVWRWGDEYLPADSAALKPHWEVGEGLGILNFERSAKIAQSRFVALMGLGAALERALIAYMLDRHTQHGYTEVIPPYLVNTASLTASGQLPKFAEESFQCKNDDLWLSPTAEVPLTNLMNGEIVEAAALPKRYVAHTQCFRSEAGSAGRDTAGMLRQHQFEKVEMVSITHPSESRAELDRMTSCAQGILEKLGLAYRTVVLCVGDMGFGARQTHDIEVWLPGQNTYREISSCSVCGDFQARRMNARFRPEGGG